jgi:hypothetical protein
MGASYTSDQIRRRFALELAWSLLRALALVAVTAVIGRHSGFGGADAPQIVERLVLMFVAAFAVQAMIVLGGYVWLKLCGKV